MKHDPERFKALVQERWRKYSFIFLPYLPDSVYYIIMYDIINFVNESIVINVTV